MSVSAVTIFDCMALERSNSSSLKPEWIKTLKHENEESDKGRYRTALVQLSLGEMTNERFSLIG